MSGARRRRRSGCGPGSALLLILGIIALNTHLGVFGFFIFIFVIIMILSKIGRSARYDEAPATQEEWETAFQAQQVDPRIKQIGRYRDSIIQQLTEQANHPILSAMDLEIRAEADAVEREANDLMRARDRILGFLRHSDANENEIVRLEYDVKTEPSDRIRETLQATLDRKRAELDNVRRLTEQLRYLDALLNQAEATLAELHSRIGLAISQTEEYTDPRSRLALTEASGQLRSVSDAMRETLKEIA